MLRGCRRRERQREAQTPLQVAISLKERFACYLRSVEIVRLHVGRLVSLRLLGEGDRCAYKAAEIKKNSFISLYQSPLC